LKYLKFIIIIIIIIIIVVVVVVVIIKFFNKRLPNATKHGTQCIEI